MIPAPGFQNPIPYFLDTDSKKLNTSELTLLAFLRSFWGPD